MADENVFFEDWQQCLREHYLHVVRNDDQVTEPSLREVLLQNAFTVAQLSHLYDLALLQRQYGADYDPDPEAYKWVTEEHSPTLPIPSEDGVVLMQAEVEPEPEALQAEILPEPEPVIEADTIVAELDSVPEEEKAPPEQPPQRDPEPPPQQQMSMF